MWGGSETENITKKNTKIKTTSQYQHTQMNKKKKKKTQSGKS